MRFDLAHTFPGNAEFGSQLLQSDWLITESACLEDVPLAVVEDIEPFIQRLSAPVGLLALGEVRLLIRVRVAHPVLPLAGVAVFSDLRVQ